MSSTFYLSSQTASEARPALVLGTLPKERNGLACSYYWRTAACDGEYVHPKAGFHVSVTPERRKNWETQFRLMKTRGVEVPILKDHKETADSLMGYVADVRNVDGKYEELHQYMGSGVETALRNKLSVGIDSDYKDGQGRKYGEAIYHSTLTPLPVIDGTGDAQRIAASRGAQSGALLFLAAEIGGPMPATPEQVKSLQELLGDDVVVTEENAMDTAIGYIRGIKGPYAMSRDGLVKAEANVAELTKQLAAAIAERDAGKAKVIELSTAATPPRMPDDFTLGLLSRSIKTERESLLNSGAVCPAVLDELDKLMSDNGKPNTLALSMAAGSADPLVYRLYAILRQNKPVSMGGKTGVQTLSRDIPPATNEPDGKAVTPEEGVKYWTGKPAA